MFEQLRRNWYIFLHRSSRKVIGIILLLCHNLITKCQQNLVMKKAVGIIIAVLMAFGISILVYSHCHDTLPCEQVVRDVCEGNQNKNRRWRNGDYNDVDFLVNPTYSGQPSMLNDAKEAAKKWYDVFYQGREIAFRPEYDGTTTKKPGGPTSQPTADGVNVVGWRDLGQNSATLGRCFRWMWQGTNNIKEADIALNYYKLWKVHSQPLTGSYFCMRNILVHEFGHFAGLWDVYDSCSEYPYYTMYGYGAQNHAYESLMCEDEYALHYKYGFIPVQD